MGERQADDKVFDFIAGKSRMAHAVRNTDWSVTPFGPVKEWPQSLKSALSICIGCSFPIAIYWGEELALVYNDDWSPILGAKHPWALGRAAREVWPEIWDTIGPLFSQVTGSGEAIRSTDQLLAMNRHGFTEECYFDYTFSPIRGQGDKVEGIFNAVVETTFRVISERRTKLLRDLNEALGACTTLDDVWNRATSALRTSPHDAPLFAIYQADGDGLFQRVDSHPSSALAPVHEEDGFGMPHGWIERGLAEVTVIDSVEVALGQLVCEPWPEPCHQAVLLPVAGLQTDQAEAVLNVCVSPRLRLDSEYLAFIERIALALSSAVIRVRTLEQERARTRQLTELDRAKTVFFSNISHEFRTPLTLMLGPLTDLLQDAAMPANLQAQARIAERNAVRLSKLVNALLEFSRIEAGRQKARFTRVDLRALTGEYASAFESAMVRADLGYDIILPEQEVPAYVDVDMWERVVLNLVSNALKFTLHGRIQVKLHAGKDRVYLEVRDSGVGIATDQLPRLFERFHRIEGSGGRTHEGSGIGLALIHELVRLHGGTILVDSQPGVGSTFTVSLPLGRDHLPAEQVDDDPPAASRTLQADSYVREAMAWMEPAAASTSPSPSADVPVAIGARYAGTYGARVVVADDNLDMQQYLQRLLSPYYTVELVVDGLEALKAMKRERPALVVSDVMMPRMDGFELLATMRSEEQLRSIPVILLSARAGEEARIEGLHAGADDYLVKPFTARELLARVGALIALDRMRRSAEEQLRLGLAEAQLFTWEIDLRTQTISMSDNARFVFEDPPRTTDEGGQLIHPADRERHQSVIDEAIKTKGRFKDEIRVVGRDAAVRWLEVRGKAMTDAAGAPTALSGISFDITERKELENSLRLADRRKDEFLAMLAHELRNPLAPIRNAGELLLRFGPTDDRMRRAVEIVNRQAKQLARLVDDLLDVSRITRGRVELHLAPIDLSSIVSPAVEAVEGMLKDKGQRLTVVPSLEPLPVQADAARLQQCLVNLLTNACKYTEHSGHVEVSVSREGNDGVIRVRDTGDGIAKELLPDVFELFVQAKRTLDRSQGGLGIGLSVVKALVELHGGQVRASSEGLGHGSTFEMRLPLAQAPIPVTQSMATPQAQARKILVVDDNRDAAESVALLLTVDSHEVRTVYGAHEALHEAERWHPDVVFIDIGLPDMDGHEVARRLRAKNPSWPMKLVALTGYGQGADRRATEAAGFDAHLIKPATAEDLLGVLLAFETPSR